MVEKWNTDGGTAENLMVAKWNNHGGKVEQI